MYYIVLLSFFKNEIIFCHNIVISYREQNHFGILCFWSDLVEKHYAMLYFQYSTFWSTLEPDIWRSITNLKRQNQYTTQMVRSLYEKEPIEAGKYVIVIFVLFMKIKSISLYKIAFSIYFRCKKYNILIFEFRVDKSYRDKMQILSFMHLTPM